jgi:hypothetical protein
MHMISYDQSYDGEFMRLWTVVSELSEHVNQTRSFIASLLAHASEIKVGLPLLARHATDRPRSLRCTMLKLGLHCVGELDITKASSTIKHFPDST